MAAVIQPVRAPSHRTRVALLLALAFFALWVERSVLRAGTMADPYEVLTSLALGSDLKLGFVLRADSWGGDLPVDGTKRIEHTLFRGNDYRFYVYSTNKGAKISFHIEDQAGAHVEARCWQKQKDDLCFSGADISPKNTGSFYLVVKVEQSSSERVDWALLYAFK